MSAELLARAETLREAACCFAEAIELQDGIALDEALQSRVIAFDAFMAAAQGGLDADTRRVVDEILNLDQATQEQACAQLSGIREELDQIRNARRLVTEKTAKEAPRFVSRRA